MTNDHVARAATLSGLEGKQVEMLSVTLTRMDWIRNEDIRRMECVRRLGDKAREARLRWFGHVQRKDSECKTEAAEVGTGRQEGLEEEHGGDLWMS